MPGLIGEPSVNDPKKQVSSVTGEHTSALKLTTASCPRTLKDLLTMTRAAKEAQWGGRDESDDASSTGLPVTGSNFFDDDSDGSSDTGEDQTDEVREASGPRSLIQMFDNSFSSNLNALVNSFANSLDNIDQSERVDVADGLFSRTPGPTSDMLSPYVKVSHAYDQIALNKQSPGLAMSWKFGDFDVGLASVQETSQVEHIVFSNVHQRSRSAPGGSVVDGSQAKKGK